ncbi:MAG: S-adenosylmethionine decarboxylase [archaeon]|nr:S-adenosylmethionine decarboxylase [archaeon]
MENFAPDILRQRMVIEGIYSVKMTPKLLKDCMQKLSVKLGMKIIYGPIVKNIAEKINPLHGGYESILIWAESGASIYTWKRNNFFTVDIYTCRRFDPKVAVEHIKEKFEAKKIDFKEF